MIRKNPLQAICLLLLNQRISIPPRSSAVRSSKVNVFVGPYAVIRADEVDANGEMVQL